MRGYFSAVTFFECWSQLKWNVFPFSYTAGYNFNLAFFCMSWWRVSSFPLLFLTTNLLIVSHPKRWVLACKLEYSGYGITELGKYLSFCGGEATWMSRYMCVWMEVHMCVARRWGVGRRVWWIPGRCRCTSGALLFTHLLLCPLAFEWPGVSCHLLFLQPPVTGSEFSKCAQTE